ncbi:hypothetical protein [Bradyrhizobium sp. URHD0069]|uniref:pPIWI-associating nuclease domain-containing protein n=1 Tax=Bradyrhizobium sp. URHD0069 TaxID=1380355 RepID=UPI0018CC56EB
MRLLDVRRSAIGIAAKSHRSVLAGRHREGAQHALVDTANPLRLNFFCAAMRILFEHMIGTLAPVDQVTKAEWFVAERANVRCC